MTNPVRAGVVVPQRHIMCIQLNFRKGWINRRTKHGGDGSDHDPAWVELEL